MNKLSNNNVLRALGWRDEFAQHLPEQFNAQGWGVHRVTEVQRTGLVVAPQLASQTNAIPIAGKWFQRAEHERPTVGDWVVVDPAQTNVLAVLPRFSLLSRLSPAGNGSVQLLAANVDTAFVVTSCNADFSVPRLERYVAAVLEAGIQPVIVLTKIDLIASPSVYAEQLTDAFQNVAWHGVNALSETTLETLRPWCAAGQTIALLGSSGVGKSTLVNTLMGVPTQRTQAIREDDSKGRHTTTHRSAHLLPQGAVILDSPGMREFQISEAAGGIAELFADIETLAQACRFRDCAHNAEPGCAVRAALDRGELDERRLDSYNKLKG